MPDLESQLRRFGADLDERFPDLTVDEITGRAASRGRPAVRPRWRVAVVVALVAGIVGVGLLVLDLVADDGPLMPVIAPVPDEITVPDGSSDDPAPSGDGERAEPSDWPRGLLVPDRDGVYLVSLEAPERWRLLDSGGFGIAWVLPDQRGGLIFQHTETPEPWPPGAILRLRAGAVTPEVLVPPVTVWEPADPEGVPGAIAGLLPFGIATTSAGHATFVYTAETGLTRRRLADEVVRALVMGVDLDDDVPPRTLVTLAGEPDPRWQLVPWVLVGGDRVVVVDDSNEDVNDPCLFLRAMHVDDGARQSTRTSSPVNCLPGGSFDLRALSHDGRTFATVEPWIDGDVRPDESFDVTVINVTTGGVLEERTLEAEEGWQDVGLVPGVAGWLTYVETETEIRLLHLDGNERARLDKSLVPASWEGADGFWNLGIRTGRFYHQPLELAPNASLAPPSQARQ